MAYTLGSDLTSHVRTFAPGGEASPPFPFVAGAFPEDAAALEAFGVGAFVPVFFVTLRVGDFVAIAAHYSRRGGASLCSRAMDSLLEKLVALTEIVPESAELGLLASLPARSVSLTASRINEAAQDPAHGPIVEAAVQWAQRQVGKGGNRKLAAMKAADRLGIEFVRAIAERVPGHVCVELDGRLAYQKRATIDRARELVAQLEELGVAKERLIVKLPATLEGIEAAKVLGTKSDIRCMMTLVFGIHQVAASADAGAYAIAPSVSRFSDSPKSAPAVPASEDPGVQATLAMRDYLRTHGYPTRVAPCAFRSAEHVLALAGVDSITLAPTLIEELRRRTDDLELGAPHAASRPSAVERLTVDAAAFNRLHSGDSLATTRLQEGIRNLGFAVVAQQQQLGEWIASRQNEAAVDSTMAFFNVWDFDGDGYIDREEWNGTDAVFNALDRDKDGRISVEELAVGLGAPSRGRIG
jgi:transaldolase